MRRRERSRMSDSRRALRIGSPSDCLFSSATSLRDMRRPCRQVWRDHAMSAAATKSVVTQMAASSCSTRSTVTERKADGARRMKSASKGTASRRTIPATIPAVPIFTSALPNSNRPRLPNTRDQPLTSDMRDSCGRMRSPTKRGSACTSPATSPAITSAARSGAKNSASSRRSARDRTATSPLAGSSVPATNHTPRRASPAPRTASAAPNRVQKRKTRIEAKMAGSREAGV